MKRASFLLIISMLAALALACSININLPNTKVVTGPTQIEKITIAAPDANDIDIQLALGAGELLINPGSEEGLVSGTVKYNVSDFKPVTSVAGGNIFIKQGDLEIGQGIPSFDASIENQWDILLDKTPLTLRISAGAYTGEYEFGGINLQSLYIEDGASSVNLNFSEPNLSEMSILSYQTGASTVSLSNLGNANLSTLVFRSGLGDYTLDFSGDLQRDLNATVDSGLSNVKIIIPSDRPAKIILDSKLTNVTTRGDWEQIESTYFIEGSGPSITITIDVGAGNVELRQK